MSGELGRIREEYMTRLHLALHGVSSDVVAEVRQEIEAHIEDALAARGEPSVGALLDVLARLGPPEAYASDVALYSMVDLGYRRWSLRHMIGSARFWAFSTAAGALVVTIFGLLYLAAAAALALGAQQLLSVMLRGGAGGGQGGVAGIPPWALLLGGLLAVAAITVMLRWFIGQYVRRARPEPGAEGADVEHDWVRRTSRRILALALGGMLVAGAGGLASGALRVGRLGEGVAGETFVAAVRPAALASPAAWLGLAGLAVFFLAPMIGLVVGVLRERISSA
jgi:hypothetical protein